MKTVMRRAALAGLMLVSAGGALAGATVTYAAPEKFSDMPLSTVERERVLKDLSMHFDKLATTLPAGQELKVEILDVDLAGRLRYDLPGARELRVLKGGADWPHIHLRYAIEQNGQVLKSGEEKLSSMMYLDRYNRYTSGESLRNEKQMLDEWFKNKVAAQ